jgi:midasin (ATPase involved in ribosome maturation)
MDILLGANPTHNHKMDCPKLRGGKCDCDPKPICKTSSTWDWEKDFDETFDFLFKSEKAIVYTSRRNLKGWISKALQKVYLEAIHLSNQKMIEQAVKEADKLKLPRFNNEGEKLDCYCEINNVIDKFKTILNSLLN